MPPTPWICPACGCGNAPETATCGACVARQLFAPVLAPQPPHRDLAPRVPMPVLPFFPWPPPGYSAPLVPSDWPPAPIVCGYSTMGWTVCAVTTVPLDPS